MFHSYLATYITNVAIMHSPQYYFRCNHILAPSWKMLQSHLDARAILIPFLITEKKSLRMIIFISNDNPEKKTNSSTVCEEKKEFN